MTQFMVCLPLYKYLLSTLHLSFLSMSQILICSQRSDHELGNAVKNMFYLNSFSEEKNFFITWFSPKLDTRLQMHRITLGLMEKIINMQIMLQNITSSSPQGR